MKLAPQMIQSIEILQLPMLALIEHIQQELEQNPVLEEVVDPKKEDQTTEHEEDDVSAGNESDNSNAESDAELDKLGEIAEDWRDYYSQTNVRRSSYVEEQDKKHDALENTASKSISMEEYLMGQLHLADVPDSLRPACEQIIFNLDSNGYLSTPLEELIKITELPLTIKQVKDALKIVQALEPPGIGARDLKECLLLQLDKRDPDYEITRELIANYLDDIQAKRYLQIAKKFAIDIDTVKKLIAFIRTLNPNPISIFSEEHVPYIIPEVKVESIDDKYEVILLENNNFPQLHISSFYRKIISEKNSDPSTKQYIKKKIESARWLIDAIEQRRNTLYKVAVKIVEMQKKFLDEGIFHLRTLKMQEVADDVGIHVSTVSRAIAHKYMQTPQGIFEMKFFFTGGFKSTDGTMESWEAIRQKLSDIIAKEDKSTPLSDEEIAETLKTSGVDIARRTVTKYRKNMKIPSSRQRKEF
jgi:RNA polymerase sigma-54 factor